MMDLQLAAGLFFTLFIAPVLLFLGLARVFPAANALSLLLLAWTLAPSLLSRLVTWGLRFFPHQSEATYLASTLAAFCAIGLIGWGSRVRLREALADLRDTLCGWVTPMSLVLGVALGGVSLSTWFGYKIVEMISWLWQGWQGSEPWIMTFRSWLPLLALPTLALAGVIIALLVRRYSSVALRLWSALSRMWNERSLPHLPALARRLSLRPVLALLAGLVAVVPRLLLQTLFVALVFLLCWLALGLPLYENDATLYFKIASLLYQDLSLTHYPVMPAYPGDGTYSATAHPLGYHGQLIWSFLVQSAPHPAMGRMLVVQQAVAGSLLLWVMARRFGGVAGVVAAVLMLSTPVVFLQATQGSIDAQRLALSAAALLALGFAVQQPSWRSMTAAGLVLGLFLNSHSQSMPLLLILVGVIMTVPSVSLSRRAALGMVALAAAAVVGGDQYAANYLKFGRLVNSDVPIWSLVPELKYEEFRTAYSPDHSLFGRLRYGALLGFTSWFSFGYTLWLGATAAVLLPQFRKDRELRGFLLALLAILAFLVVFFCFTQSGRLLIMNVRYSVVAVPFAALLAGCAWFGLNRRSVVVLPLQWLAVVLVVIQAAGTFLAIKGNLPVARIGDLTRGPVAEMEQADLRGATSALMEVAAIRDMRRVIPADAVILTFHFNLLAYYGERTIIRDADPRLIPFYRAKSPAEALDVLRGLGVTHIHLPNWPWPTITHSFIRTLVEDKAVSELVSTVDNHQAYRLLPPAAAERK